MPSATEEQPVYGNLICLVYLTPEESPICVQSKQQRNSFNRKSSPIFKNDFPKAATY